MHFQVSSRSGFELWGARNVEIFGAAVLLFLAVALPAHSQIKIEPRFPGEPVTILPSDAEILASAIERKDLPCTVTPRKAQLGFDLQFHTGFDVNVPLNELEGGDDMLTIVFRVYPEGKKGDANYFSEHITVPKIEDDAAGDAFLQGYFNVGVGNYHVDWLMRDRQERFCSESWDTEAILSSKDQEMRLFISPHQVKAAQFEPFQDEPTFHRAAPGEDPVNLKLLVNFAPEAKDQAALPAVDLAALVGILKTIEHDPRVGHVSLIAFNMQEHRVLYRQAAADRINFPALGRALQTLKLGTVTVGTLGEKHGDTDFLGSLIEKEVGTATHPDAVVFAGPKAMLDADVPQEDLKRIGDIECPVFYLNYNPNPQAVPWKDSISHAVKFFKGTEYTITRPRDLWFATSDMVASIVRSKQSHAEGTVAAGGAR